MASGVYTQFLADLMNKVVDLEADTIKCGLLTSSHTFTATNTTWADVSANEVSGTGYTAGGATLASKSVTEGTTTKFDATDVTWSSSSITARYAVIYDTTASNNLMLCVDFGEDKTSSSGDFTIQWNANGIATIAGA